ncbi:MAG: fused MFS/spermidine synthase [Lachnospiraceae bacterium]
MSVMAIELGASRLLAPYFSSSQIVWTVIIGTIMIAMALGNIWGGKMADKNPNPVRLYSRLLLAALWTAMIPLVGKYVIAGISIGLALFVTKNFLVWASLVSCLVLFVFPLMLLGTVTPSLVKYTVEDLDNNGAIVGRLGALNTIGSIIGTFVPTFITIPAVGTAATFYIFAAILALLSLCYFISAKQQMGKGIVSLLLIGILSLSAGNYSFAFWEQDLTYEGESIYNYLQVKEDDKSVTLSTNVLFGVQSIMMKDSRFTGMYYDYALAAPYMAGLAEPIDNGDSPDRDILILGLGTGTYATMCDTYFPEANIEGVEIDRDITELAKEYFSLPESVKVSVYDGRAYLSGAKKYDVIMVDAYQDITIPFQMSTVEMFTQVRDHLKENGVMVVNMNMRSDQEGAINDYLCDTIASVFPHVYTATVQSGTNTELFASMNDKMVTNLETWCAGKASDAPLHTMMNIVKNSLKPVEGGSLILTDDKAPVELLGMKVIDEIIGEELDYYKRIFKSGNFEDLL